MTVQMFYLQHLYNPDSELFAHLESIYNDEDENVQADTTHDENLRDTPNLQNENSSKRKFGKLSSGYEMLNSGELVFNNSEGSLNIGGINRGVTSNIREVSSDNIYSMRTVR